MTEANAILFLFDLFAQEKNRRFLRVLDLFVYVRHALEPGALDAATARRLSRYDPSMIFLALDYLRRRGLLDARGSAFCLTDEGVAAVAKLHRTHPEALTPGLREAAKQAA